MPKIIEDVRNRILEKAYNIFIMEGYDNANTNKIARECNIAAGTLFNYFPTKWDLLIEVLCEVKKRGMEYFIEMIEDAEEDQRVNHLVSGMYFIIGRVGKLGKEFFSFLLLKDEEFMDKLQSRDVEIDKQIISAFRRSFKDLSEASEELIRLILRSIQAIVISTYTEDKANYESNKKFACKTIKTLLMNVEDIKTYTQEVSCEHESGSY